MKIKLSRTVWVVLTIGVLLLLFLTLGIAYRGQLQEQDQLNNQIAAMRQKIAKYPIMELSTREADINKQLVDVEAQIGILKTNLTQSTDGIDAANRLYEMAETAGVELIEVRSSGLGPQNIEKMSFITQPLTLKVKGDAAHLIEFILSISKKFSTGVVKSVEIYSPPAVVVNGSSVTSPSAASIVLDIYSYEGK